MELGNTHLATKASGSYWNLEKGKYFPLKYLHMHFLVLQKIVRFLLCERLGS